MVQATFVVLELWIFHFFLDVSECQKVECRESASLFSFFKQSPKILSTNSIFFYLFELPTIHNSGVYQYQVFSYVHYLHIRQDCATGSLEFSVNALLG